MEFVDTTEEIKEFYKQKNWPYDLEELPKEQISKNIENYIQGMAKKDLPKVQFQGNPQKKADFVEIGGILAYNKQGKQVFWDYYEPDESKVIFKNKKFINAWTGKMQILSSDKTEPVHKFIHFHSHPKPYGPSPADIQTWQNFKLLFSYAADDFKIFHAAIYYPNTNSIKWYNINVKIT